MSRDMAVPLQVNLSQGHQGQKKNTKVSLKCRQIWAALTYSVMHEQEGTILLDILLQQIA